MPRPRHLLLALLLALAAAQTARAAGNEQRDEAVFDFYVKGFRVGLLVFAGVQSGDYYAVNGRFATAGLASLIKTIRYDATVHGTVSGDTYRPDAYELTTHRGKRQTVQTIGFRNGTPQAPVENPPHAPDPEAVNPATQTGAVDALTAIYATLRKLPEDKACQGTLTIYDGVRRATLTLWPADGPKGVLACGGEYRRVAGYSKEDMAEPVFPFRMSYAPTRSGEVEVSEIDMSSIYGRASLKRR